MITCTIFKINEEINHSGLGRAALSRLLKKMGIEEKLAISSQGKPHLLSNIKYVSSSHSGKYLICAIADQPIGIDIEKIRELHPGIIARLQLNENPFEQWTLREAMTKLTDNPLTMFEEVKFDPRDMRLIDVDPGYVCVIVSDREINEITVEKGGYYE
jgi:4'-phosphopantetheinyl transferase